MSFSVLGLGTSVPANTMTQAEALELAEGVLKPDPAQKRTLKALYRRAGVRNRHTCVPYQTGFQWAELPPQITADGDKAKRGASTQIRMQLYEQHAGPQAIAAAAQAIDSAEVTADEITHIVTVSCTGFCAPGIDAALIRHFSLRPDTQRVHVGFMGCHGAINGLRVVDALAQLDPANRILMCAVELCSLHYYFAWHPEKLISNALFADGAAALVGGCTESNGRTWHVLDTASCVLPDSHDSMTWKLGDYGFEMTLCASVPEQIARSIHSWLSAWLQGHGFEIADIEHWAIHPGGPRIIGAVADALDLPAEATGISREILAKFGNMSSPTVLFIAKRLQQLNVTGPCVVIAFGPGLVAEVALIQFGSS